MKIVNVYQDIDGNDVIVYSDGTSKTVYEDGATYTVGTDGDDKLHGTSADDTIDGLAGDDKITGGGGNDTLTGGADSDQVLAGGGDDIGIWNFESNADNDANALDYYNGGGVNGDQGNDLLIIQITGDELSSLGITSGDIEMHFLNNNDGKGVDFRPLGINLFAKNFENILVVMPLFTENADVVDFNNVLAGTYIDGTQFDALDGNDTVTLPNLVNEAASGFTIGTLFTGGAGDDLITGGDGNDVIDGGLGNDVINAGSGDDVIIANDNDGVDETADGGSGTDLIDTSFTPVVAFVNDNDYDIGYGAIPFGFFVPTGSSAIEFAIQAAFTNLPGVVASNTENLTAGDLDDYIVIRVGTVSGKIIDGGDGNDTLDFGWPSVVSSDPTIPIDADLSTGAVTIGGVTTLTALNFEGLRGAFGNDTLTGNDADNVIVGRTGDDLITTGGGNDTVGYLRADFDNDTITDFTAGMGVVDVIDLSQLAAGGPTDFNDLVNNFASDDGTDTLIDFGSGNSITLLSVVVNDLAADDFIF